MRTLVPVALAIILLAQAPTALAHGSAITHVQPFNIELPPGEQGTFGLEFEEGDLRADWVFLLNAVARDNAVTVTLRGESGVDATWNLPGDGNTHYLTGRVRKTEAHGITVFNPGPNKANVTLYYDASCNCAGKPIPPDVPNGAVIFNVDVQDGDIMRTQFPEPPALKLRVTHALRVNDTSVWPKDFRVLSTSSTPTQKDGKPVHVFDWTADRAGRFYFFVEAIAYDESKFDPSQGELAILSVYVEPDNQKVGSAKSPGPAAALALAALVLAALARRPKRNG